MAFKTADDYPSSIDMATALHPQTLLATQVCRGDAADPFGYPLRLRTSTKLGFKNPKWITAIEVTNTLSRRLLGEPGVQLAEQSIAADGPGRRWLTAHVSYASPRRGRLAMAG